ncbi:hypothetical protein [Leptothoe spongobia]|uniref:Uncharacterized protein n=1 Tax=Leptothoe spongobia TAU-MAC 1115 TaxID=1967444 RepID=A0A947GMA2_9CYAN|nr:hypothetical protein [Leptothoe spongobia]MBT9317878.1 hypothetical protein [Leptothoe spongobia TAU-MAC 1115]
MVSVSIDLGDTFLIQTPSQGKHLYIAIAPALTGQLAPALTGQLAPALTGQLAPALTGQAAKETQTRHLFVSINHRQPQSETVCILEPGPDVPDFIIHESVVNYRFARELTSKDLAKLIPTGSLAAKGQCSSRVLQRIQAGGLASKRLKNRYKLTLKDFMAL